MPWPHFGQASFCVIAIWVVRAAYEGSVASLAQPQLAAFARRTVRFFAIGIPCLPKTQVGFDLLQKCGRSTLRREKVHRVAGPGHCYVKKSALF